MAGAAGEIPGTGGVAGAAGEPPGTGGAAGAPTEPCSLVWTGDVELQVQSDVDFLHDVSVLYGDLRVTGEVTDLGPLGCLHEIVGDLQIAGAISLSNVDGLDNLRKVSGGLFVGAGWGGGNPVLSNIDALGGLESAGSIYVANDCSDRFDTDCTRNEVLEQVSFQSLVACSEISLEKNPALTAAHFDSVQWVKDVVLAENEVLNTATFASLSDVYYLGIDDNPELATLTGFGALTSAGSMLDLSRTIVTSLAGLDNLAYVTTVNIVDAPLLSDISSLSHLNYLNELTISGTALADLHGLEGLYSVGQLRVLDDPSLGSLGALSGLHSVYTVQLDYLPLLQSLDGLHGLSPSSRLYIQGCSSLQDLSALSGISELDSIILSENASLASLVGLEDLEKVSVLGIYESASLESLHELSALTSITDYLGITDNDHLPTCEAEWLRDRVGKENIGLVNIVRNDDAGVCAP